MNPRQTKLCKIYYLLESTNNRGCAAITFGAMRSHMKAYGPYGHMSHIGHMNNMGHMWLYGAIRTPVPLGGKPFTPNIINDFSGETIFICMVKQSRIH